MTENQSRFDRRGVPKSGVLAGASRDRMWNSGAVDSTDTNHQIASVNASRDSAPVIAAVSRSRLTLVVPEDGGNFPLRRNVGLVTLLIGL